MKLMDDTNHLTKQFAIKCSSKGQAQTLAMDLNFLGSKQATSLSLLTFAQRLPRFRHAGTPRYIIHVIRDRYGVLL